MENSVCEVSPNNDDEEYSYVSMKGCTLLHCAAQGCKNISFLNSGLNIGNWCTAKFIENIKCYNYGFGLNIFTTRVEMLIPQQTKSIEVMEYLLKNGCDVNATNALGETPLHLAAGAHFYGEYKIDKIAPINFPDT